MAVLTLQLVGTVAIIAGNLPIFLLVTPRNGRNGLIAGNLPIFLLVTPRNGRDGCDACNVQLPPRLTVCRPNLA